MSNQSIIVLEPKTSEQIDLFKSMAKAFKLKFEVKEKPYNPEFVEKIMESKKQAKNGQVARVKKDDLMEFLGL